MLHKKITAVILIVLFQQIGAASVYAQDSSTGENISTGDVVGAAVTEVAEGARLQLSTDMGNAVLEDLTEKSLEKYVSKVAAKAAAGVVGFAVGSVVNVLAFSISATPVADATLEGARRREKGFSSPKEFDRRLKRLKLNQEDFFNDRDLRSPGAKLQAEADLRRELLRREARLAVACGESYFPDQNISQEIRYLDGRVEEARKRAEAARKRAEELALQESLAGQTTGLVPPIGDARFGPHWTHTPPTLEMDVSDTSPPELLPPLPPRLPDWRRRSKDVVPPLPPRKPTPGQLLGGKGLNIAGILNVFAFDSARQDGDSVQLTVRDSRGTILSRAITLTNAGSSATVLARRGIANVTITALNEGRYPPNTGGLRVRGSVSGVRSGNFNLSRGQSGTLTVRVLGN